MTRPLSFVLLALAATSCSKPASSVASRPQVRPETATHAAVTGQPAPSGTPTPQPAEPNAHGAVAANGAAAPGGARHFGAAIEANIPSVRLSDIVAAPDQHSGHPVRVEGEIVAVCQEMGCWMEIRDQQVQAHARMHGHAFFLPRDVSGRHAVVAATVLEAQRAHSDCDRNPNPAPDHIRYIDLDALGVDVL